MSTNNQHILESVLRVLRPARVNDRPTRKPLNEAVMSDLVLQALKDFARLASKHKWALAGGLAVSVYNRPRATMDIDIIVPSEGAVGDIATDISSKFKRPRDHCFRHKGSDVEIDVLTPDFINADPKLFQSAMDTAEIQIVGGIEIKVVDPRHLVAMKLDRFKHIDRHDIEQLCIHHGPFDLSGLPISDKAKSNWKTAQEELAAQADDDLPKEPERK